MCEMVRHFVPSVIYIKDILNRCTFIVGFIYSVKSLMA